MKAFFSIFAVEAKSLVRSKSAAILFGLSLAWMFAMPYLIKGDGTLAGAREVYLHYSLGGVFALLTIALMASATGTLARERAAKRLQLTMIRPVRYSMIVLAKIAAHVILGAAILGASAIALACRVDVSVECSHVLKPILPSPREEAKEMYSRYMNDTETPPEVKKAPKATVMRLLENRAIDHYQTIPTNTTVAWHFTSAGDAIRVRLTNPMEMRQSFFGRFISGNSSINVSNMTQSILVVPFKGKTNEIKFENLGKSGVMLRPRKDVEVLVTADSLGWNLIRTWAELVGVLALIIAFGALLSAALGRPVALFVAIVTLLLSEMSPSVIEQYPDELHATLSDRIGLTLTRFAAEITRPVSSISPLSKFSKDECVERAEVIRMVLTDLLAMPILLALLSGFILPRKQSDHGYND